MKDWPINLATLGAACILGFLFINKAGSFSLLAPCLLIALLSTKVRRRLSRCPAAAGSTIADPAMERCLGWGVAVCFGLSSLTRFLRFQPVHRSNPPIIFRAAKFDRPEHKGAAR